NDAGFSEGLVYFDPTGQRIIQWVQDYAVYDTKTLLELQAKTVNFETTIGGEEPLFSHDGASAALPETVDPPNQMPAWVPQWIHRLFELPRFIVRVVSLADGKTVRQIPMAIPRIHPRWLA